MMLIKLIVSLLLGFSSNSLHPKVIIFGNDAIIFEENVSHETLSFDGKTFECSYKLAELKIPSTQIGQLATFPDDELISLSFSHYLADSNEKLKFEFTVDKENLFSRYLIVRFYTRTKENKKIFDFNKSEYIYEYESPFGYNLLARKRN